MIKNESPIRIVRHLFRSISCLNQVLFAINEQYCINEKKAVRMIEGFKLNPRDYKQRMDDIFTWIGADRERLVKAVSMLRELISETEELVRARESRTSR